MLAEYGLVIPQGICHIAKRVPEIIEDARTNLPGSFRLLIQRLVDHLKELDRQVGEMEAQIQAGTGTREQETGEDSGYRTDHRERPGGLDRGREELRQGRQVAARLGLVPRQHSSGGKPTLLGISKRGDSYLRTLLIHGARAVIWPQSASRASRLAASIVQRRNQNVAAVALANKNARSLGVVGPRPGVPSLPHAPRRSCRPWRRIERNDNKRENHRLLRQS